MNDSIKESIERIVGLPIDKIRSMTLDEERELIRKKNTGDLNFSNRQRKSVYGRGNPLLARKKYRTIEYIDKKILDIEKNNSK